MAKPGLIRYNANLKKLIDYYGGKKKKKKKTPSKVVGTVVDDEFDVEFEEAPAQSEAKVKIKKTDMIRKRKQQEDEERNQQIIENAQRRKEWLARKAAEKAESDRLKEEKRRAREQALMEQHKAYYENQANQTNVVRPDFTYQANPDNTNLNGNTDGRSDN